MKNPLSNIIKGVRGSARAIGGMFRSKYIELILAVALFILLDTGVLIINFYTSYQIANDAHAIQLASRMGTQSQRLLHELYRVQDDAHNPEVEYLPAIDALADTYKVFDETLDAFIYGGDLIGQGQGKDALLQDAAYRNTSAHLLKEVEDIWKTYRTKLKPIVYAYFNKVERNEVIESSQAAISYARLQNDNLLHLMQSFATSVEGVAQRKAQRLRIIQSIGISLAVINFFLILFHFLKRLKQSDALVEKSRKETEDILENVDEGLLLLDQHYMIGSQHSKSLHVLFKEDNLAGKNFIDLLRPLVTEKTLDTVEEYTEILFSPRANESLISGLNPLKQVEVNLTTDVAAFDIRHFSFQFSRVYEKKRFHSLLVTVKDITEQIQLSERLKAANEKASKEIDMLLAIIHVENTMLTDFLQTTEEGLNNVNGILKKPDKGTDSLKNKLESIFRIVHKLKGDSTVLGLEFVMEKFHTLESAIAKLKEKRDLTGEDFLPLVIHLSQLITDFTIIGKLQKKMKASEPPKFNYDAPLPRVESPADTQDYSRSEPHWKKQLSSMVERIVRDYNKEAILDMSDFDVTLLSKEQTEPVKDIIVQSLRNSVAHGLETPMMRESAGKPLEGNLKVALKKNGAGLQLTIRDDGQGIDVERIKARAISTGLATENQLSDWHRSKLLSLIFLQGFTTAQETNVHAGHGVGMDLIKSRLDSLKGQAKVRFQTGRYTEFQYDFKAADAVV
jgi:HPt (histidine-containing phosphotransfer) domain-containing protein